MTITAIRRTLEAEYAERLATREEAEKARLLECEQADPALAALLAARRNVLTNALSRVGVAPGGDPGAEMRALNQKIAQRMAQLGAPQDALYDCAACHDTGWLLKGNERCACFERALDERIRADNDGALGEGSFESFNPNIAPNKDVGSGLTQRKMLNYYREKLEGFADRFPTVGVKLVLLYGGSGLGKTFLLNAVARRVRERRIDALCLSAPRMFEALRDAFLQDDATRTEELFQTPLLLIDDLGMEPMMNKITIEQLFLLTDERLRAGRPIVISSNLMADQIKDRYNERIASRLFDGQTSMVMQFMGDDLRAKRAR